MRLRALEPFIPSGPDFARAKAFFLDLGFELNWEVEGLAELALDGVAFLLQDFHNQEMQENLMMFVSVEDLDAWWRHIESSGVLQRYEGVRAKEPTDYPGPARSPLHRPGRRVLALRMRPPSSRAGRCAIPRIGAPRWIAALFLSIASLGCEPMSVTSPASAVCSEAGVQCQLPEGPLGVCERAPCAPRFAAVLRLHLAALEPTRAFLLQLVGCA